MNAPTNLDADHRLAPDREAIRRFLSQTIGSDIHLVALDPTKAKDPVARWFGDDAETAASWAVQYNGYGWGIYWTVNLCKPGLNKKPKGGGNDLAVMGDMIGHRFLHVDIDPPKDGRPWSLAEGAEALAALRYPPSFTIASGGGMGAFWRLDETVADKLAVTEANRGLAQRLGGDHCHNHDRVMRLPGTINYPDAGKIANGREPAPAFVFEPDDGVVYPLHALAVEWPPAGDGGAQRGEARAAPQDFELLTADDLDLGPLDPLRSLIDHPAGRDRSTDAFACAGAMHRAGLSDTQIMGILMNPANAVSAHILDQRDPRYQATRILNNSRPQDGSGDPGMGADAMAGAGPKRGIRLTDFHAYMPAHNYIFAPSGEFWPGASINSRIPPIPLKDKHGNDVVDDKGNVKTQPANQWLDQHRPVEQMTWAPGEPQVVSDRLISDGGWIARPDCNVFNLYRPPVHISGDGNHAGPWLDHIRLIYPDDADHIINWLAHRVQRPSEKLNHAIVMGGAQGIGKDTILEPVKAAIGPWNFAEVSPQHMLGRFNGFVKSVILRVSEARDLGDVDRFAFYDHMKTYTAAPPDVLRVDEKHVREYAVFNVCGVIITTNHKTDGIFLPADDRRHYVAWSDSTRETFGADYWPKIYGWYASGGIGHVAAYLRNLSLAGFDPKAPPPKTSAFWDIVSSNQAPEDAELADAIDRLGCPNALTLADLAGAASDAEAWTFRDWLTDRRNARKVPHRLEECGYAQVRNRDATDGLYKVNGKRRAIYARKALTPRDAIVAAEALLSRSGQ